jgi:hypothetical protein
VDPPAKNGSTVERSAADRRAVPEQPEGHPDCGDHRRSRHRRVHVAFFVVQWHAGIAAKPAALLGIFLVVSAGLAVGLSRLPYVSTAFGVKRRP